MIQNFQKDRITHKVVFKNYAESVHSANTRLAHRILPSTHQLMEYGTSTIILGVSQNGDPDKWCALV